MKNLLKYSFHQLVKISPVMASHLLYSSTFHKPLRLRSPQTINEKLMWLNLFEVNPMKTMCADKLAVRRYVSACGYEHLLIDLLAVYDTAEAINFEALPNRFILKCTHGSGYNIVCLDQATFQKQQARTTLGAWQRQNYSLHRAERHYKAICPRIVAEVLLDYDEDEPLDYHIHCFHGEPQLIEVRLKHGYVLLSPQFELQPFNKTTKQFTSTLKKPKQWLDMLHIARTLSAPFTYVRVDLYDAYDVLYFSELTFTPSACLDTDFINGAEYEIGRLLDLTQAVLEKPSAAVKLTIKRT